MSIKPSSKKNVNSITTPTVTNFFTDSLSVNEAKSKKEFTKQTSAGEEFLNIIIDDFIMTPSEAAKVIREDPKLYGVRESDIKDIEKDGQYFLVTLRDGTIYKIWGGDGLARPSYVEAIGHEGSNCFVNLSKLPRGFKIESTSCDGGKLIVHCDGSTEDIPELRYIDHRVRTFIGIDVTFDNYGTLEKYDIGNEYTVSSYQSCSVDLGYENPNALYSRDGQPVNQIATLDYVTVEDHTTNTINYYRADRYSTSTKLIATHNKNTNTTTYNVNYYTEGGRNNGTHIEDSRTYNGRPDVNWMAKYCTGQEIR